MTAKIVYVPGYRYGRLTVLGENGRTSTGQVKVDCRCDCGAEINVRGYSLRQGRTQSCGCYMKERSSEANTTHGHTTGVTKGKKWSPTYLSWTAMISRCCNTNAENYSRYGGAGVTVCREWFSFVTFLADMGDRPEGTTLDRIDATGDYEPGNCRWATATEQAQNKRPKGRRDKARERTNESFKEVVT